MACFLLLCTLLALVRSSGGLRGVDFAGTITPLTAQCLVKAGYGDFGIVRAWHSYGAFDTSVSVSVSALWQGGFKSVDVYLFPCPTKNIGAQVRGMVGNLSALGVRFGSIWLDIEEDPSTACSWSANKDTNCGIMAELALATNSTGLPWGTYTSTHEWTTLMGENCVVPLAASNRLWYPHYERPSNPSFSDFKPFGGWMAPYAKQYDDTIGGVCEGVDADVNWRP